MEIGPLRRQCSAGTARSPDSTVPCVRKLGPDNALPAGKKTEAERWRPSCFVFESATVGRWNPPRPDRTSIKQAGLGPPAVPAAPRTPCEQLEIRAVAERLNAIVHLVGLAAVLAAGRD